MTFEEAVKDGIQKASEFGIKPFPSGDYRMETDNGPWILIHGILPPTEGHTNHIGTLMVTNPNYKDKHESENLPKETL